MNSVIEQWDADPIACFGKFVETIEFVRTGSRPADQTRETPMRAEGAKVYKFMFGKFARWLASRSVRFSKATHNDLLMFLKIGSVVGNTQVQDLNSKISYRYLRLIERCYHHLKIAPNPARHAIFGALKQQRYFKDTAMVALNAGEIERFMAALPSSLAPAEWRRRRDRAIQLTMLFAGLRVSEVLGLLVDEISLQAELDGSHKIELTPQQKHSTSYEHTTILRPPAVNDVLAWVDERSRLQIPGSLAFPAPSGKRLNASTVYLQVKSTLASAKIDVKRSGGRTLRNTYAVQEITLGTQKPTLTKQLGLALERSTDTYINAKRQNENPDHT
ncbi:tyrosine-type recombinase/integrase [Duganella qianjiadongensis]|uniref:Tyrosine-type recombinase/integrase n=1 Tax=Duganella qianjiadongensis TaxID=2692176 RepID=A0ABW9VQR6_9BURK|nr:tyrosine-type recombinase/integrase [Duganella qianjiadongensis]MYM41916.1 tyrosine-type recombinase/integrase [Duganella qianjiadongensis]